MFRFRWPGWWLAFSLGISVPASSQNQQAPLAELEQNFPNPFTAKTTIPFEILPRACTADGTPRVTIQILNVLVQVVATPAIRLDGSLRAIQDLELDCGRHLAVWDRHLLEPGQVAGPGSYFYRLFVNGESQGVRLMQLREPTVERPQAGP